MTCTYILSIFCLKMINYYHNKLAELCESLIIDTIDVENDNRFKSSEIDRTKRKFSVCIWIIENIYIGYDRFCKIQTIIQLSTSK